MAYLSVTAETEIHTSVIAARFASSGEFAVDLLAELALRDERNDFDVNEIAVDIFSSRDREVIATFLRKLADALDEVALQEGEER